MVDAVGILITKHVRRHGIGREGNLGELARANDIVGVALDVKELLTGIDGEMGLASASRPLQHDGATTLETAKNLMGLLVLTVLHGLLALAFLLLLALALLLAERFRLRGEALHLLVNLVKRLGTIGLLLRLAKLLLHLLLLLFHLLLLLFGDGFP